MIYTDPNPLAYASASRNDRCSPRETQHVNSVFQYNIDIHCTKQSNNLVEDAVSCPGLHHISNPIIPLGRYCEDTERR